MNTFLVFLYWHENLNLSTFLFEIFLKNLLNFEYLKNDRYQAILGIYQGNIIAKSCLAYTGNISEKNISIKYEFAGGIFFLCYRYNNRSVEVVCVIGATSVLDDVLLAELYWRTTQGRSLHSSYQCQHLSCNDILVLCIQYDF